MGEHRGRGLGAVLKSATLGPLQRDRPDIRAIHTWNAVDNEPMQRTNRTFGFRPVEVLLEMQRKDD